jgi:hypothetical protein
LGAFVLAHSDSDYANNVLGDDHSSSAEDEQISSTKSLDHPERDWSRQNVNKCGDQADEERIIDGVKAMRERQYSPVQYNEVDSGGIPGEENNAIIKDKVFRTGELAMVRLIIMFRGRKGCCFLGRIMRHSIGGKVFLPQDLLIPVSCCIICNPIPQRVRRRLLAGLVMLP